MTSEDLKPRSDLHVARRLWHLFGVGMVAAIYWFSSYQVSMLLISLAFLFFAFPDYYRLRNDKFNQFVLKSLKWVLRRNEANALSGVSYLIVGVFVVVALFPKSIGTLSFLFLAFGDPVSSIFGILYGKDKIVGEKSLQGSAAGFLICTLVALVYYLALNLMHERLILAAILSGLIGACSELIPIRKLDDNLTSPIISSFLLWALFYVFGAFNA